MDVFSLEEVRAMARTEPYWTGRMSATIGIAIEAIDEDDPKRARRDLRGCLAEFIASPVPQEELRRDLRRYLGRKP